MDNGRWERERRREEPRRAYRARCTMCGGSESENGERESAARGREGERYSREVIYRKLPVRRVALGIGQSRACGTVMCGERARESQAKSEGPLPTYCRDARTDVPCAMRRGVDEYIRRPDRAALACAGREIRGRCNRARSARLIYVTVKLDRKMNKAR